MVIERLFFCLPGFPPARGSPQKKCAYTSAKVFSDRCEEKNIFKAGINTIAQGCVDQPVFSCNRHGWFGTKFGERV